MTGKSAEAIESNTPEEGPVPKDATFGEWVAWQMRGSLPTEESQRPAVSWPTGAGRLLSKSPETLIKLRAAGDHPRLYAIGRDLYTTMDDLRDWILAHELKPGQMLRPATIPKGTKRPAKAAAKAAA